MATKIGNNEAPISTWRCLRIFDGFKNRLMEDGFRKRIIKEGLTSIFTKAP
jgi:hypothetical protein